MKQPYIRQKTAAGTSGLELDEKQLRQINRHTQREFSAEELYAFRVVVCDNEVDRDHEAFRAKTLNQLAKLFEGKTMLTDHSHSAKGQCARIFAAHTEQEEGRITSYGEPYTRLIALCYMPCNEDTKYYIQRIEAGILKEVSVGCAVRKVTCSICDNRIFSQECEHRPGVSYEGEKCFAYLEDAADAYEVSFVAVPAQTAAGITKEAEPDRFAAELMDLTCGMKELGGMLREIQKHLQAEPETVAKRLSESLQQSQQVTIPEMDPETQALVRDANRLVEQTERSMQI